MNSELNCVTLFDCILLRTWEPEAWQPEVTTWKKRLETQKWKDNNERQRQSDITCQPLEKQQQSTYGFVELKAILKMFCALCIILCQKGSLSFWNSICRVFVLLLAVAWSIFGLICFAFSSYGPLKLYFNRKAFFYGCQNVAKFDNQYIFFANIFLFDKLYIHLMKIYIHSIKNIFPFDKNIFSFDRNIFIR